ncbi:MAG: Holliday junction branch migration protein RuvA [Oscillospiraceae bacterium]|nr:Holliday junction branch migration protein RuvA [Oscillospiraceae bacterium]
MFYYLEGNVSILENSIAVIDAGGVGFLVNVTMNTLGKLQTGKKARLYTSVVIREDAFDIYGFYDQAEKRCFELLTSVSGVGPKAAQSVLSALTPEGFAMAVISENEKAITAAQGVGKRIAQRIILELKDKMAKENIGMPAGSGTVAAPGAKGDRTAEAVAALTVLGYSGPEINAALRGVSTENMTTEEIIKYVLKSSLR